MNKSKLSSRLKINRLELVGRDKNYIVNFHGGLNIIYGDSDTGKSSILDLINYSLGSSSVKMYEELEIHGQQVLLEVVLNGEIFTIERDIHRPNRLINVYACNIENIEYNFPLQLGPNYKKQGPNGFFSDFLLESLNIPLVEVRQSPTKPDSKTTRLSFRDIFKFCYLDQDNVGNQHILDQKNFVLFTKNKETFKFIHDVLDTQLLQLQKELAEKKQKRAKFLEEYNIVSSFLRETRLDTEENINRKLQEIDIELRFVGNEISKINTTLLSDTEKFEYLRQDIASLENKINFAYSEKSIKETQLEQNIRLKKEYKKDIEKLEASIEIKENEDFHEQEVDAKCPVCDRGIELNVMSNLVFENYTPDILKNEVKKFKSRINDIDGLIIEQRNTVYILENDLIQWKRELAQHKNTLDMNTQEIISPYLAQRDEFMSKRAALHENKNRILYYQQIRNTLNKLNQNAEKIDEQIRELRSKLEELKDGTPELKQVLGDIADILSNYLNDIPIRNAYGISINAKTFLPIVRNRDYHELTSGGLRTIVSIGYLLSLLIYGARNNTYLPTILMIDTVGKYLGTSDIDPKDAEEHINDPTKYHNLYRYLMNVSEELHETHQIIVVDNQLPGELSSSLQQYVIKHFSVDDEGDGKGFIDNA
jgi:AAA domain